MEEPRLKPFIVLKSDPRWDACITELRRLVDFAKSAASSTRGRCGWNPDGPGVGLAMGTLT